MTISNNQPGLNCETMAAITVVVGETPTISEVIIEGLNDNNTVEVIPGVMGNFEYQLDNGPFQTSNLFNDVAPGLHTVTINDLNGCGQVTDNITVVGYPKFFLPTLPVLVCRY